jgi:multidrug resistance efflux pump
VRWKRIVAGIAVLAAVAAGVGFFWPFGREPEVMRLPGIVEIQEVRLGSKVGGRVEKVLVKEGEVVPAGKELVIFAEPELQAQRDQLQARLYAALADLGKLEKGLAEELKAAQAVSEAAEARWVRLKNGWREEEKLQAQNELASAEADRRQGEDDYDRVAQLFRQRALSRADYDAALASRDRARGRAEAARARYTMLMAGSRQEDKDEARAEWERTQAQWKLLQATRPEEISAAKARADELRAKIREIDVNLDERIVKAPASSQVVIEVLAVREGDIVPANQPIIRALRVQDLWVRVYVPEPEMGKVRLNQPVEVMIDSYPDRRFKGQVVQINAISEFTPRNVQSLDERRHQVFGVKVQLDNPQGVFHAGMAAEVLLPLQPLLVSGE